MADIPEGNGPEQRIRQGMEQHIAIRMRLQALTVRNLDTTKNDGIAFAKGMDIKALTNPHAVLRKVERNFGRNRSQPAQDKTGQCQI
ncbi:hypothetical protein GCM10009113_35110 [Marinobacter szutsaonensis]